MTAFFIRCTSVNRRHTHFAVFDQVGANCGHMVILTADIHGFLACWKGDIQWQGLDPFQWLPPEYRLLTPDKVVSIEVDEHNP